MNDIVHGILGVFGIIATVNLAISGYNISVPLIASLIFLGALLVILWK
jgi:hypothetical protein